MPHAALLIMSASSPAREGEGQPRVIRLKRKRASLACESCRQRKRKCDGARPMCLQCVEHQVLCNWPEVDRRKSRISAAYRSSASPGTQQVANQHRISDSRSQGGFLSSVSPEDVVDVVDVVDVGLDEQYVPAGTDAFVRDRFIGSMVGGPEVLQEEAPMMLDTVAQPDSQRRGARLSYEYIRPYGPTAIRPGLGRLRLSLRGNNSRSSTSVSVPPPTASIVDQHTRLPREDLRSSLLDVYFEHFRSIFPFLDKRAFLVRLASDPDAETILLANTMCALSARFSTDPEIVSLSPSPFCRGVPFADNAKQLLIPLLSMPSANTTAALLFLAWYEFGMNSEGGLWNYSGMALRMAVDLGFHRQLSRITPRSNRTLFWCIYILDRTLSIGTGRTTSLPDRQIDIADPDDDGERLMDKPSPAFAYVVKFTRLYGRIAEIVNESPTWLSGLNTDVSAAPTRAQSPTQESTHFAMPEPWQRVELVDLATTEDAVLHLYEALPSSLVWSIDNLSEHVAHGDGEIYLHLHLWYNCIIAILYREPLLQARASFAGMSHSDALEVQKQAARSIHDITVAVEPFPALVLNQPFINQCFYTSACTWLADIRQHERAGSRALAKVRASSAAIARINFTVSAKVLRAQSDVWAGVGWIAASLAKRGAGLSLQEIVDSGVTDTILSADEMRILTSYETTQDNPNTPSIMDLWSSILQSGVAAENEQQTIYEPMWGADGLFDASADQILFGDSVFSNLFR